ncbi:MAG TPA: hypothetical protein VGT03_04890 [Candidatus Acidoferrales bacterium]|nr:hypothetical protein [Candidatus Acidoferrales bacterium]
MGEQKVRITVVAAVGIGLAVILSVIVIRYLVNQQNYRGPQPGQSQESNGQQ